MLLPALAQDPAPEAKKVGKVLAITGQTLMTNRNAEGRWFKGYEGMPSHMRERFKTDGKTQAVVEFLIGGQAIIKPGTEIEIIGDRSAKTVGNQLLVRSGTIWAKVNKQNSELRIKTAGGTMGIEGTEFVIDVDDDGNTTLSVLEGAVKYTDNAGNQQMTSPGDRVVAGASTALRYRSLGVWALRDELRQEHPALAEASYYLGRYIPGVRYFGGREAYWAYRAIQFYQDPQGAAWDVASDQVGSRVGHGLGGIMRRAKPKPAEPVSNLAWEQDKENDAPRFSWEKTKAHDYAVLVANDSDGKDIVWAGKTEDDHIRYPSFGPELQSKMYHLFIIPLNEEGKPRANKNGPLGKSRPFMAKAFKPNIQAVANASTAVDASSPRPKVSWDRVSDAGEYRVDFAADAAFDEMVWSGRTKGTSITYPEEARPLDVGTYYVRVTAFDETGYRMAESSPVEFAAAATWESQGLQAAEKPNTLAE